MRASATPLTRYHACRRRRPPPPPRPPRFSVSPRMCPPLRGARSTPMVAIAPIESSGREYSAGRALKLCNEPWFVGTNAPAARTCLLSRRWIGRSHHRRRATGTARCHRSLRSHALRHDQRATGLWLRDSPCIYIPEAPLPPGPQNPRMRARSKLSLTVHEASTQTGALAWDGHIRGLASSHRTQGVTTPPLPKYIKLPWAHPRPPPPVPPKPLVSCAPHPHDPPPRPASLAGR